MELGRKLRRRLDDRRDAARELNAKYIHPMMGRAARTLEHGESYHEGSGSWLVDRSGERWLDWITGYGAHFFGHNHPDLKSAFAELMSDSVPGALPMTDSLLQGLVAEALVSMAPSPISIAHFCSGGAEAVEHAIKFARIATGRRRLLHLDGAFHGLSCGALSLCGQSEFRADAGPFLADSVGVAPENLERLESELASGQVAAFFVEPIQGYGVRELSSGYLREARSLCRRYGTLFVADEIMTGMGRTGAVFACEHSGVEPDMILVSKALTGGLAPGSAILYTREIYNRLYRSLDQAGLHLSTFAGNKAAMVAALASIELLHSGDLVARAGIQGARLARRLRRLAGDCPLLAGIRGRGLMLGVELSKPTGAIGRLDWRAVHRMDESLLAVKIVMDLARDHRVMVLPAGRAVDVLTLLPPVVIGDQEIEHFTASLAAVLGKNARFPGIVLGLGANAFVKALRGQLR